MSVKQRERIVMGIEAIRRAISADDEIGAKDTAVNLFGILLCDINRIADAVAAPGSSDGGGIP